MQVDARAQPQEAICYIGCHGQQPGADGEDQEGHGTPPKAKQNDSARRIDDSGQYGNEGGNGELLPGIRHADEAAHGEHESGVAQHQQIEHAVEFQLCFRKLRENHAQPGKDAQPQQQNQHPMMV